MISLNVKSNSVMKDADEWECSAHVQRGSIWCISVASAQETMNLNFSKN